MTSSSAVGDALTRNRSKTVLVVDDAGEVRDVTQRMLERAGFRVLTARDGLEAAKAFCRHENEIDVVIMDLVMPELDGVETLRVIRGLQEDAKIILITGYPERLAADRWRELGFAGFIPKPYTSAQVINAVQTALGAEV